MEASRAKVVSGITSGWSRTAGWPVCWTILTVVALGSSTPRGVGAQAVGPARGSLVVSGGGETTSHIIARFIELAGGPAAPIVVVPTSGRDDEDYDEFCSCLDRWREAGATNLTVLHTRDRSVANTDSFAEPLRRARGVWFNGGSHWLHTDAYLDTKVHEELFALLDREGLDAVVVAVEATVAALQVAAAWIADEFTPRVQKRGAEIIELRKLSSAASAGNAA
ncbi:MAG TPA: hypothetical protein EYQ27_21145, partial [Gemmatimonadetes bacterium]|nr:hypothetical protein [Gemmatimonadota bacterium]